MYGRDNVFVERLLVPIPVIRSPPLLLTYIDNFKLLNDAYGHDVGDLLLIEVTRRIVACLREIDTVARFGGVEFVVVLSDLNADRSESIKQANIVAEKIRISLGMP